MKIKELKELIKDLNDDMEIILSKDAEGNNFCPLSDSGQGIYIADAGGSWFGEIYHDEWSADDALVDQEEWNEILKKPRCLVLWPVN